MLEALIGGLLGGFAIWFCVTLVAALAAFLFGTTIGRIIVGITAVLFFLYGVTKRPKLTLVATAIGMVLLIYYYDAIDVLLGGVVFLIGLVLLFGALFLTSGLLLNIKDYFFRKTEGSQTDSANLDGHTAERFLSVENEVSSFHRSWRTPFARREKTVIHIGFILYLLLCAGGAWTQLEPRDWVNAILVSLIAVVWYAGGMAFVRFMTWIRDQIDVNCAKKMAG
ncbi:MAG: hypothetical protein PHN92_13920 [Geobacter sp.]|nr:hypothetical protein [Geobacter sp.]